MDWKPDDIANVIVTTGVSIFIACMGIGMLILAVMGWT